MRKAVDRFCARLVERSEARSLTESNAPAVVGALFLEEPGLHRSICTEAMKADLEMHRAALLYVRPHEMRRYKRQLCRLSHEYLDPATGTTDLAALLHDHPDVWSPFCASGFQVGFNREADARPPFTQPQIAVIARRSCTRAVQAGAIDVSGPRGFLDAKIDERAFERIVMRTARSVLAG